MHIIFSRETSFKRNAAEILNDHLMNYCIFYLVVKRFSECS